MDDVKMSLDNISGIIDKLLKTKDPATIGLRRIIKKKNDEGSNYPARELLLETFDVPGKSKILTDDERRILELEKKVIELESKIKKQVDVQKKAEEAAFNKGHIEGAKIGKEKGVTDTTQTYEKKIDLIQQSVGQFLKSVEDEKKMLYIDSEHLLLKLAFEMVNKIIQTDIASNQEIILTVLKRALTYVSDRERIVIHVSPLDLAIVTGRKDFWSPLTDQLKNICVEEDPRIEKGGCLIESNSGQVDARLGIQFEELCGIIEKEWEDAKMSIESTTN